MTENNNRKIEQIETFCCLVDGLIELVNEKPDWISRDSSTRKAEADIWGKELNNLAVKIWPQIHFDKANQPYQPKDVPAHMDLVGVLSATPSHIESIIRRWQEWKERALAIKANIIKENLQDKKKQAEPSLKDLKNPIKCTEVAAIAREMSHNIAAKLRRRKYPVVCSARKNYCEVEHAMVLYPNKREALKKYIKSD